MDRGNSGWPDEQGEILHPGFRICEWSLPPPRIGKRETDLTENKAAKRYIPDWPGIDKFQGTVHHSSFWPDEEIDIRGKHCAVIGTGASGVQISQEWGPVAESVKVFQRTPNLALPMGKKPLTPEEQTYSKQWYQRFFEIRERSFGGFLYTFSDKNTFEDNAEEREKFYQSLFDQGGFLFWLGNYKDYYVNPEANQEAYNFWAKKVRSRIGDPRKRDLLAPLQMPHYFGIKRPCLEQNYFEQFNRESVDVIDVSKNGIKEFDETGIILQDGTHHEVDVIAIATGFVSASRVLATVALTNNTSQGHHDRRHDPNGPQIHHVHRARIGMASCRQHLFGAHRQRLPEHVPYGKQLSILSSSCGYVYPMLPTPCL